jgi:hypothetical protein
VADSIDKYRDLWIHPEKHVLVLGWPNAPSASAMIVEATTLAPLVIDTTPDIYAEVTSRMLAGGVEAITPEVYQQRLREPRWGRRDPQHVYASVPTTAHHVRLSDGRFQRVFPGSSTPLHCGFEHILAAVDLAQMLERHCAGDIELVDATIFDPVSRRELSGYRELVVRHELVPEDILEKRYVRARAWHHGREALFVAPEVRDALVEGHFAGVAFAPGFSRFAAAALL